MTLLFVLSILGLTNALFLHYQHRRYQKTGKKIFCLIGEGCHEVVESKYGVTFGIKNEVYGTIYYVFLILHYFFRFPVILVLFASFLGAIFSFYLLYLQSIVLKKFCSWCLIAIGLNLAIFINLLLI